MFAYQSIVLSSAGCTLKCILEIHGFQDPTDENVLESGDWALSKPDYLARSSLEVLVFGFKGHALH